MKIFFLVFLSIGFMACNAPKNDNLKNHITVNEVYQTERNEIENIDSPAFWKKNESEAWLIATAKSTDRLHIYDASDGRLLKMFGKRGTAQGEFKRPNGISVSDSLLFIVERDNRRIQVLSLPDFKFAAFIGNETLVKPYGIYINKVNDNTYMIYVSDNYETFDEQIPEDSLLNERVHIYKFTFDLEESSVELVKKFGDTAGNGRLKIVESLYGDPQYNNLLIAEEKEDETCVKVYDLDGNYKNKIIGKGLFNYQVEGIALYKQNNEKGYWIITDQDSANNVFHLFDRMSFNHLGSFLLRNTTNTDGIWLSQESFRNFKGGAFFAVHNDGNISAGGLEQITKLYLSKIEKKDLP